LGFIFALTLSLGKKLSFFVLCDNFDLNTSLLFNLIDVNLGFTFTLTQWSESEHLFCHIFTILCFINSLSLTVCYLNVWLVGHFLTGAVLLLFLLFQLQSRPLLFSASDSVLLLALTLPRLFAGTPTTPPCSCYSFCYLQIPPPNSLFAFFSVRGGGGGLPPQPNGSQPPVRALQTRGYRKHR